MPRESAKIRTPNPASRRSMESVDVGRQGWRMGRCYDDEISIYTDDGPPLSPCSSTSLSFYSYTSDGPQHSPPAVMTVDDMDCGADLNYKTPTQNSPEPAARKTRKKSITLVRPRQRPADFVQANDMRGEPNSTSQPSFASALKSMAMGFSPMPSDADFVTPISHPESTSHRSVAVSSPISHPESTSHRSVAVSSLPGIVLQPKRPSVGAVTSTPLHRGTPQSRSAAVGSQSARRAQAASTVRHAPEIASSHNYWRTSLLDAKPPSADDFVQTRRGNIATTPPPDFVRSQSRSSDALDVIACQPDLQVLLSGSVKSSALLRNNPDFIPAAVSPVQAARARRRSLPEKKARDERMQRFLDQRKVIQMEQDSQGRCTHTEVAPSSMMTLAMELLVSGDNKAGALFKQAKKKADDEAVDRESILPNLWVVPKEESENAETTASHLKPSVRPSSANQARQESPEPLTKTQLRDDDFVKEPVHSERVESPLRTPSPNVTAVKEEISKDTEDRESPKPSKVGISEDDITRDLMTLTVADLVGSPDTVYTDTESEFETENVTVAPQSKSAGAICIDSRDRPTARSEAKASPSRPTKATSDRPTIQAAPHKVDTHTDASTRRNNLSRTEDAAKVTNDMFSRQNKGRSSRSGAQPKSCLSDSDVQPCKSAWSAGRQQEQHADSDCRVDVCGIVPYTASSSSSTSSILSNSSSLTTVSSLSLSSSASSPASPPSTDNFTTGAAAPHSRTNAEHKACLDHALLREKLDQRSSDSNLKSPAILELPVDRPSVGMSSVLTHCDSASPSKHWKMDRCPEQVDGKHRTAVECRDKAAAIDLELSPTNTPPKPTPAERQDNAVDKPVDAEPSGTAAPRVPKRRQSFHRMKEFRRRHRRLSGSMPARRDSSSPTCDTEIAHAGTDNLLSSELTHRCSLDGANPLGLSDKRDKNSKEFDTRVSRDVGNAHDAFSLHECKTFPASSMDDFVEGNRKQDQIAARDTVAPCDYKETSNRAVCGSHENKETAAHCINPPELIYSKGHARSAAVRHTSAPGLNEGAPTGNTRPRVPSHNEVIHDAYYVIGNLDTGKQQPAACAEWIPTVADLEIESHMREGMRYDSALAESAETNAEILERQEQQDMMHFGASTSPSGVTVVDGSKVLLAGASNVKSHSGASLNETTHAPPAAIYMDDILRHKKTEATDRYTYPSSSALENSTQDKYVEEEIVMPSATAAFQTGPSGNFLDTSTAAVIGSDSNRLNQAQASTSRDESSFNAYARPFLRPAASGQVYAPSQPSVSDMMISSGSGQSQRTPTSGYMYIDANESNANYEYDSGHEIKSFDQRYAAMGGVTGGLTLPEKSEVSSSKQSQEPVQHLDNGMDKREKSSRYPKGGSAKKAKGKRAAHGYSIDTVTLSHARSPTEKKTTGSEKEVYSSCVKITLNPSLTQELAKKERKKTDANRSREHSSWPCRRQPGQGSRASLIERVRNEQQNVREVTQTEKNENANGSLEKQDLPAHSTEDESDFAGVVDGPSKNVKEIRAMFKKGPDYANYAKPKLLPRKPMPPRTYDFEEVTPEKSKKEEIFGTSPKDVPNNEVAKQVMGLFKGALTIDVPRAENHVKSDNEPVQNGESHSDEPTISVKDKVASFNSGKSPVTENGTDLEKEDGGKETHETLKLSTFAPYAEIISNPEPKTQHKAALQTEKVKADSYDESLDQFYDMLDELTAS